MDRRDRVWIAHPDDPTSLPVSVPRSTFVGSYELNGWLEVDAPELDAEGVPATVAETATVASDTSPQGDDRPASEEDNQP